MTPDLSNLEAPAVVLSIAASLRILGLDKMLWEMWAEIVKVWLSNRVAQQNIVASHHADNVLTHEYGMVVIGYYYSQLARRMIDIASVAVELELDSGDIPDYIRVRISPDVQRVRKILSLTKLDGGQYLSMHLIRFLSDETKVIAFYEPIAENFYENTFSEIREIILRQTDKLYSEAELFFEKK